MNEMDSLSTGRDVWRTIQDLWRGAALRKAAIPYVSSDQFVKFQQGDLLVCDASDETLLSGATSGSVIQRAVDRGARVVSLPNLHAKVLVLGKALLVGSTNLSVRSVKVLTEALLCTKQKSFVAEASAWIDGLARIGTTVDAAMLRRLLALEASRPPMIKRFRAISEPHVVFFKEVVSGDIEKFQTHSSVSGTGGGARDLRIPLALQPLLKLMFSEASGIRSDVSQGSVVSKVRGQIATTDVELWPPTQSRPNELRIARFYTVPGWDVSDQRLQQAHDSGDNLFYVAEMDVYGTTTAKVLTGTALSKGAALLRNHIARLTVTRRKNNAITGAVDLIDEKTVPS